MASTCCTTPSIRLPLRASCPTAWVCHGLDWYVMPWASRRIDRLSHKFLVPRYARKADAIIAVSEITREHVIEYLPISPANAYSRSIRASTILSRLRDAPECAGLR